MCMILRARLWAGTMPVALFGLLLAPVPAAAQSASADRFTFSGDVRAGYFASERTDRDGSESDSDDWRARVRLGAGLRLSDRVDVKVRAAGRFSTEQESFDFFLRTHVPTVAGLALGDATLDEVYVNYRPSDVVSLRVGRFQSKFVLADLMGKSLDRVDSPNMDISWTDGAHLTVGVAGDWDAHLIVQHNASDGPTNVLRPPLDVSSSRSRVTWFGALENTTAWGPVVQRALDVTYIPGALRVDGIGSAGPVEGYLAVVARAAVAWPVGAGRLLVGGEAGYAPNTPSRLALQLGDAADGSTGGTAWQLAVTLADAIAEHRLGVVLGEVDAGWLIAPDFRNNDRLFEARYQWQFAASHSFEARFRHRQELVELTWATREREDTDIYLRFTSRF